MFEKFKEYVAGKKEGSASDYNLTYDVAIPEIHTHKTSPETREKTRMRASTLIMSPSRKFICPKKKISSK